MGFDAVGIAVAETPQERALRRITLCRDAMAEAHDAKQWQAVVDIGTAWMREEGDALPLLCCVFYAQALMGIGQYDAAVPWAEAAVKQMPSATTGEQVALMAARATYAQALSRVGRFVLAKSILKKMVANTVVHPETMEKQGHTLLAISEKWRQGWSLHEARASNELLPDNLNRWDGSKQPVAVLHEQGIGDAVLFARWLPRLAEVTGHPVTWFGPEQVLGRWMADLPGVVVGDRTKSPQSQGCEQGLFAMSLPHVLHCDRPQDVPPAVAPRALLAQRSAYRCRPWAMTVGLCWKGAVTGWHDFERSFTAEQFAPLWADLPCVTFVNLCHQATVPDAAPFASRGFADVSETGEVIAGLDLVVSVDTAVVHLAGSLGVPTLCLAPTVPDWRYQWPPRSGHGSPFYPTVTVVRKQRADDVSVLLTARAMIEQFTSALR